MSVELSGIPGLNPIPWENIDIQWKKHLQNHIQSLQPPHYFVFPETPIALASAIKLANESNWQVLICGNGSKLSWGGLVKEAQLVISTQRLNRIIDHAIGDLTVTVEAGMTIAELQKTLIPSNQFLPLDPCYPESATIGGIIATMDAGNWRQGYGGVRDLLLGLSFVRADGVIAKAGGRVVKNVAGYDLMKLFCGSFGRLGIITQATIRLYPNPDSSTTLILQGSLPKVEAFAQIIRQSRLTPTAAEMVSNSLLINLGFEKTEGLLIRFQGMDQSIEEQKRQVSQIAKNLDLKISHSQSEKEISVWQKIMQLTRQSHSKPTIICKIGIIPNQIAKLITQINILLGEDTNATVNVSTGLGYLQINQEISIEHLRQLRNYCQENQGYLTILEAPIKIRQEIIPWKYNHDTKQIMVKIKEKFDKKQIFNPSIFSL